MTENKYNVNISRGTVAFVKPVVERNVESKNFLSCKDISLSNINKEEITKNVESKDFSSGKDTSLSNINKEEIIKEIEEKDIQADSKSSIEVVQEIKYDHNLTNEQLEREE